MILEKPVKAPKSRPSPIPRRKRLARGPAPRRSSKRIRTRVTLGAKRRAAKAAGGVDPATWEAICDFYREGRFVRCAYCVERLAEQQDHVVPISRGGKHEPANVVPACSRCNYRKGTQTWEPKRRHPFMEAV